MLQTQYIPTSERHLTEGHINIPVERMHGTRLSDGTGVGLVAVEPSYSSRALIVGLMMSEWKEVSQSLLAGETQSSGEGSGARTQGLESCLCHLLAE